MISLVQLLQLHNFPSRELSLTRDVETSESWDNYLVLILNSDKAWWASYMSPFNFLKCQDKGGYIYVYTTKEDNDIVIKRVSTTFYKLGFFE